MTSIDLRTLSKGEQIGQRQIPLSRADLVRYAGASGDYNPIHWDERFAQEVGLGGVIAHGMLTMGLAIQLVTDWVQDPAAIIDYQTRFSKPVPVPQAQNCADPTAASTSLTVSAKIGAIDLEAGTVRVDLKVQAPAADGSLETVLVKAQAIVKP
ncbi:MAG: MaoC family dehydratase [Rothia sp. (in: high G+C Gram-positive bacteria)]|nr:MaoC family dehydratase [Rothia sp. (in: high G+C Gram-positive bacteria)]